jgi:hypothetical protein
MTYDEFKNGITSIDKNFDEVKPKELSIMTYDEFRNESLIIDKKFDEAKKLFLEIYDEYVNSSEFKEWILKKNERKILCDKAREAWERTETYKIDFRYYSRDCIRRSYGYGEPVLSPMEKEDRKFWDEYAKYLNIIEDWQPPKGCISYQKYLTKMELLKSYLGIGVDKFPSEWYHHENCKS